MNWPKGKYNGRPIFGIELRAKVQLNQFHWKPRFHWGYGSPYFGWLIFHFRATAVYGSAASKGNDISA